MEHMLRNFKSPISTTLEHLSVSGGNQYGTAEVTAERLIEFMDLHIRSPKQLCLSRIVFRPMDFPKVIDYVKENMHLTSLSLSRIGIPHIKDSHRLFWELLPPDELEFRAVNKLHILRLAGEDCQDSLPSTTQCWRVSRRALSSGEGWSMKYRWLVTQCLRLSPDMVDAREQMYRDETTITEEVDHAEEVQENEEEEPLDEELREHEEEERINEVVDEIEALYPYRPVGFYSSKYESPQYDFLSGQHLPAFPTELNGRFHFEYRAFGGNGNNIDLVGDNFRFARQDEHLQQLEDPASQLRHHPSTMHMNAGVGAFNDGDQHGDYGHSTNQHYLPTTFGHFGRGFHQQIIPGHSLHDYNLGTQASRNGRPLEGHRVFGHNSHNGDLARGNTQLLRQENFLQPFGNPMYLHTPHAFDIYMDTMGDSGPLDLVEDRLASFDLFGDESLDQSLEDFPQDFNVPGGGFFNFHLPQNNHQFFQDGVVHHLPGDCMFAADGTQFPQHDGLLQGGAPRVETM